jgi:hypothetical protein
MTGKENGASKRHKVKCNRERESVETEGEQVANKLNFLFSAQA